MWVMSAINKGFHVILLSSRPQVLLEFVHSFLQLLIFTYIAPALYFLYIWFMFQFYDLQLHKHDYWFSVEGRTNCKSRKPKVLKPSPFHINHIFRLTWESYRRCVVYNSLALQDMLVSFQLATFPFCTEWCQNLVLYYIFELTVHWFSDTRC